jgi:hypothetical protein
MSEAATFYVLGEALLSIVISWMLASIILYYV